MRLLSMVLFIISFAILTAHADIADWHGFNARARALADSVVRSGYTSQSDSGKTGVRKVPTAADTAIFLGEPRVIAITEQELDGVRGIEITVSGWGYEVPIRINPLDSVAGSGRRVSPTSTHTRVSGSTPSEPFLLEGLTQDQEAVPDQPQMFPNSWVPPEMVDGNTSAEYNDAMSHIIPEQTDQPSEQVPEPPAFEFPPFDPNPSPQPDFAPSDQ